MYRSKSLFTKTNKSCQKLYSSCSLRWSNIQHKLERRVRGKRRARREKWKELFLFFSPHAFPSFRVCPSNSRVTSLECSPSTRAFPASRAPLQLALYFTPAPATEDILLRRKNIYSVEYQY